MITQTATPAQDMAARWRPTDQQVVVARAMLDADMTAQAVMVGLALPGKARSIWTTGQKVIAAPGFWLASRRHGYAEAREAADRAAGAVLSGPGQTAYAVIERDGTWAVFEGIFGR